MKPAIVRPRRHDGKVKVPIACTLGASDATERIDEWRAFLGECVTSTARRECAVRLTLDSSDATVVRAVDLATREKRCCAFFSFAIEIEADQTSLVITVPEDAIPILEELATLVPPD